MDFSDQIIYIGKAKDLKKRVTSYFTKKHSDAKTRIMVRKISDIKIIVVDKESDALLLENSMIKEHQPRYNILLKDDKTFPWICIKNEPFPRIFITRQVINDGSKYFGPFTSVFIIRTLLELIRKLFPLRNCSRNLDLKLISANRYSQPCLEYHIGNCLGPCIGMQSHEQYEANLLKIIMILKGNLNDIREYLAIEMSRFSNELNFEKAQLIKEKIAMIDRYQAKSVIVNPRLSNIEVLSVLNEESDAYVNYLRVHKGAIVQSHNLRIRKKIEEPIEEIMSSVLLDLRQRLLSNALEVIMAFKPLFIPPGIRISIPRKGEKLKLLELSVRNAKTFKNEILLQEQNASMKSIKDRLLHKIKNDLKLGTLPVLIECFDNSNLQGSNPVAACVVFKNGRPAKSEYRMFNIKTVLGPNDFASIEEVVFRRYKRQMEEKNDLPQLIIIDGGKGQLTSATEALDKLQLKGKIAVIGIAKKLEEIYFPGDPVPLYLDKTSETLKIIQQIRDEAHRFGITFHRKKRSAGFIHSELTSIKGIGETIATKLLLRYKSVNKIKEIPYDELVSQIGNGKARLIYNYFHSVEGE